MAIVERLKTYMEFLKLSVSQFADAAQIPRPTLSQILSGRNKKISNEILSKLHDAYPLLNISWLLFGDGSMQMDGTLPPVPKPESPLFNLEAPQEANNEKIPQTEIKSVETQPIISISPDTSKRVTSIMVFYSDSSFENFVPSQR